MTRTQALFLAAVAGGSHACFNAEEVPTDTEPATGSSSSVDDTTGALAPTTGTTDPATGSAGGSTTSAGPTTTADDATGGCSVGTFGSAQFGQACFG